MLSVNSIPVARRSGAVLRVAASCATILLLSSLPALAQEEEDPAPPVVNPNIRGTIEDKTYAATPAEDLPGFRQAASQALTTVFDRKTRAVSVTTTFGEFRPVFSVSRTRGHLRTAVEYGIHLTLAGETPGIGGSISYSPSLRDFVRQGLDAEDDSEYTTFVSSDEITSLDADIARENNPDIKKELESAREQKKRDKLSKVLEPLYEKYLTKPRIRLGAHTQWFPDSLVLASGVVSASQYIDGEIRQFQLHADGGLNYLDIERGDSTWAGRWTLGASWHNVPARYDNGKFQRWEVQVGADVTPDNAVDLGTSWSAFLRYRPKPCSRQATYADDDAFGSYGPEFSFRIGQIPGERFRPGSSARDFIQLRAQWPSSF